MLHIVVGVAQFIESIEDVGFYLEGVELQGAVDHVQERSDCLHIQILDLLDEGGLVLCVDAD